MLLLNHSKDLFNHFNVVVHNVFEEDCKPGKLVHVFHFYARYL